MRSLFFEYPRLDKKANVLADLFNQHQVDMKVKLPILAADKDGIELKFPSRLTGVFYVKIQDGDYCFLKKIAIQ
jgi:hypothetical protein